MTGTKAKIKMVETYPVTPAHTTKLRIQMTAAGVEKARARCFPDGLGRINIKSLDDREKIIRILIERGACKSWGEPITEFDLKSWNGNGGLEYFFRWSRTQSVTGPTIDADCRPNIDGKLQLTCSQYCRQ